MLELPALCVIPQDEDDLSLGIRGHDRIAARFGLINRIARERPPAMTIGVHSAIVD